MLREVSISGRDHVATEVIIEPYGQVFSVPAQGNLHIAIDAVEERVEINLNEDGGITVWLFEAGEISVWDKATLDARSARARRRTETDPKTVNQVAKELRYYARRLAAEPRSPDERETVEGRVKLLELARDLLKRGATLPNDLKAELLAWAISEERKPMREVFIGVLRSAVELGSENAQTP